MTWPAGMPLLTVTQDVTTTLGRVPTTYAVHLIPSVPTLVLDGHTSIIRRPIVIAAAPSTGVIESDQVPHLNHPDLSPTPAYYMVHEYADGSLWRQPWQLTPAAEDVTIDLDARAPIAGDPGTPVAVGPRGLSALFFPSDDYPGLYDLVETSDLDTAFSEDPLHPGLYTIGV